MESTSPSELLSGAVGILVLIVVAGVALGGFIFWIWSLIHGLTNNGLSGSEKVAWVLVILFVQILGSIIYFFIARPKAQMAPRAIPPPG